MRISKILNIIASLITISMGLFHLFVPFIFPWDNYLADVFAPINWALYAMNFFFSLLLLWGGVLTWASHASKFRKWTIGGMALFWIIGSIYEFVVPFPMDEVRWVLPFIALFVGACYALSLVMLRTTQTKAGQ